jgi:hypothetical protein
MVFAHDQDYVEMEMVMVIYNPGELLAGDYGKTQ